MKTYIHIGYPKNASTTLQTDVFPKIKNALYLGRMYGSKSAYISEDVADVIYSISMLDSIEYNHQVIEKKLWDSIAGANEGQEKLIISSESFANNVADRGLIASRLNMMFPDAKILIVIRNQMDALRSMYAFLVRQLGKNINLSYGRPSVKSFEGWILEQEEYICRSYILTLKYYELISEYRALFGTGNVSVLLFEDLARTPDSFFKQLATFLDIESINSSIPKRNKGPTRNELFYYKIRGLFPRLAPSKFLPNPVIKFGQSMLAATGNGSVKEALSDVVRDRLMDRYREGNAKLQQELGIDLASYGYCI
jgi:hypothetical protein